MKFSEIPKFILKDFFDRFTIQPYSDTGSALISPTTSIIVGDAWSSFYGIVDVEDINGTLQRVEIPFRPKNLSSEDYYNNNFFYIERLTSLETSATNTISIPAETNFYILRRKGGVVQEYVDNLVENGGNFVNSIDMDYFINPHKIHQYIGKVYPEKETNQFRIEYIGYDTYALTCIPEHNRTTKLIEFFEIVFDQVYNAIYNRGKTVKTLIDAQEIPLDYLPYLAQIFNYTLNKSYFESLFIDKTSNETRKKEIRLKELVSNIINYLKRKGTYSSLYIVFKTLFWATENSLNIYERWHSDSVFSIEHDYDLEPYFIDFNYLTYYNTLPVGCVGSEYYPLVAGSGFIVPANNCYIHKQSRLSDKWYIAHSLGDRTPVIQCFDSSMNIISPAEISCIDANSCLLSFTEIVDGYVLMAKAQYVNPILSLNEIHNHNLDQLAPIVQGYYPTSFTLNTSTFSVSGMCSFDTIMPSGTSNILIANTVVNNSTEVVVLSGDYFHIQTVDEYSWDIEHNLSSKALVQDFYLSAPTSSWVITHFLDTKDLVYQIYSNDDETLEYESLSNITNEVVKVNFDSRTAGKISLLRADETLSLSASSAWMSTYTLSGDIKIVQIYDTDYNAINDIDIRPICANTLALSSTYPLSGYVEIATPDFIETILAPLDVWNIEHNLDSLNIITNVYKNPDILNTFTPGTSCSYTFLNQFNNTEILVNVYNEFRKMLQPDLISITPTTITVNLSACGRFFVCVSPADATIMQISEDDWVLEEAEDIDGDTGDELLIELTPLDEYTKIVSVPQNVSEYSGTYPPSSTLFDYAQVMDFVHVQDSLANPWWVEHYLDTYNLNVKFFTPDFGGNNWDLYHTINEVTVDVYDSYTKEKVDPLSLYNDYFTDYAYRMNLTFSEICSGFLCMAAGTKIEQLVPGSPWTITHNLGQKEQIIHLYNSESKKFVADSLSLIDDNTASMSTSSSALSAGCFAVVTTPDYIENLVPADSNFTITHNLDSLGIICQIYDDSYELVEPLITRIVDNNNVYLEFGGVPAAEYHILVKTAYPALYQIMPNEVLLYNKNWIKGSFDRKYSGYVGINIATSTFIPTIKVNEPNIEIVDENNITVSFSTSAIGYVACAKADSVCTNLFQASPESFQIIDSDNAVAEFNQPATGLAVLREVGQLTYGDGLVMSPHYRVEVDLNCEPLCQSNILTKEYALSLYEGLETSRPASKYAHYNLLLSPVSDFSQEIIKTYDIANENADFYTYCCVDTESTSAGYVYRNYVPTTELTITHSLSSENVLVQCYDNVYETVFPRSIKIVDSNTITVDFAIDFSGLCLIGTARESLTVSYEASASWGFMHSQETSAVLSNYYFYLDKEQMLPSNVTITEIDRVTSTWYVPTLGYCQIRNVDYLHVQTVASTEWIITHTLDHNGVMVQIYDDELKQIFPEMIKLFKNKKQITITLEEAKSGYAFITCLGGLYPVEYIIESLSDGYIQIGDGDSTEMYDAVSNNALMQPLTNPYDYDLVITEDINKYYVKGFINGNKEETSITEIGLINGNDELMFYTYIKSQLYKTQNFDVTVFYRINKN